MSRVSASPGYLAQDIGPTLTATASLMITFTTVFVGLRYYARHLTQTPFGIEDILIPIAWLAELGLCIVGIFMATRAGTGRHEEYVFQTHPEGLASHFKGVFANTVHHPPAVAFPKIVVIVIFLRIFNQKWERRAAWTTLWLILATWISYTFIVIFQCQPIAFNWNKSIPGGRCIDVNLFAISSSIPNIVTDVIVLVLPLRTVVNLKISRARRVGLMLIFLTGSVGILASIIRTIVFATTDLDDDVTYNHVALVNWTIIEPGMYLLAACALSFRPLWRMLAQSLGLDAHCSHNKSSATRTTGQHWAPGSIHMDTLKTASSGGFTKLGSGHDDMDKELQIEMAPAPRRQQHTPPGLSITVTRTVETVVEDDPYASRSDLAIGVVAEPMESTAHASAAGRAT